MRLHDDSKPPVSAAFLTGLIILVAGWYVFLCVTHFLSHRPLWLDEYNVFRSVKEFQSQQFFTQKLAGGQIFPKLYLFLIQKVSQPFDFHLWSLRFLSFAAMLSAFAIWIKIARYEFKAQLTYLIYILSWAGSALLVYYSSELKQYSMDVLAAGIFVLFIYQSEQLRRENKNLYLLGLILLPFLGLLSYPAFVFFIFPLYNLLFVKPKDSFWKKCFFGYCVAILLSLSCLYLWDIRWAKADTSTQGFDQFISFTSIGEFFKSWGEGTTNLFCRFFAERPRMIKRMAMPFGILGIGYMFYAFFKNFPREGYRFLSLRTMALAIYLELFILGALHQYPFSVPRTSLFFCPIVLFLIVEAIASLKNLNRYFYLIVQGLFIVFLLVISWGISHEALSGNLGAAPLIY